MVRCCLLFFALTCLTASCQQMAGCGNIRFGANSDATGICVFPVTATNAQTGTLHTASVTAQMTR